MKKILVVYHYPCLDGFTAAYVAWREFGYEGADYVPGSYDDNPVIPDVDGRIVYILDFSYPAKIMREIAERAETVIVLDHHKSAEADLTPLLEEGIIEGEFDMERSGAGMAWDFFNPGDCRIPFIDYVEDRDLWRFKLPNSKEINIAMFSYEYTFENWDMFCFGTSLLEQEGKAILRKHLKDVNELKEQAMTMKIGGYTVRVVNANYFFGSDLAGDLCKGQPFAAYFWMNKNGDYQFGLRSANDELQAVDVSLIAKVYGGGGHKHASGFRVKSLDELNINAIVNENGSLSFP